MRIFHNVTEADRRLWKAPLVSQLFPFLWAEPHHADVSLFCEDRSWQNDFSNSRSRITAWVARFLLKRSWRTVPVARYLTNVSVCFIQLSKSCGESVLLSCKSRCRAGKRGLNKSCSAITACYSSVSKGISKSKIILISASLIRPFNSMSTTMQTLPYLSKNGRKQHFDMYGSYNASIFSIEFTLPSTADEIR